MEMKTKENFIHIVCDNITFPQTITNEWIDAKYNEWVHSENKSKCDWEKIGRWGFCYKDLSKHDLSKLDDKHLQMITFNSSTIWPDAEHMPKGFNPAQILVNGKEPMLGIKDLHEKGITGKGVVVACIDFGFQGNNHVELKNANIHIKDYATDSTHFHSECVLANLMGENIGVAPDVECYFYSINQCVGETATLQTIDALKDIEQKIKLGIKIKAVSKSGPLSVNDNMPKEMIVRLFGSIENYDKLQQEIKKLNELGCVVVDSAVFGSMFTCCDVPMNKTPYSTYNDATISSWQNKDFILKSKPVSFVCAGKVVPEFCSDDGYKFEQTSCYSWTIPQAVGMYALGLQLDPNLTWSEFTEIAHQTAKMNDNGVNLANPKEMIKRIELQRDDVINY